MKIGSKIKKIIYIIALGAVVVSFVSVFIISLLNRTNKEPAFVFGRAMLWVETESMEPAISSRSYILVRRSDGKNLEEGDIITFICGDPSSSVYGNLVTHRITSKVDEGYRTQGDNSMPDLWTVPEENIIATYVKSLPVLTFLVRILASPVGLVIIVLIFIGSGMFIYIPDIVNALKDENKEQKLKEKEIARRVEEEVRKMQESNIGKGDK